MDSKSIPFQFWRSLYDLTELVCELSVPDSLPNPPDISVRQYKTINRLWKLTENKPQGIPLKELAENLHLTPGTVSELVESLVQKNAIQRVANPNDRRAVLITLTDRSQKLIREGSGKINGLAEKMLDGVPEEDRIGLVKQLQSMYEILKNEYRK